MRLHGFYILIGRTHPKLIMVAKHLIPGDRLVEPGGLEWFLIIDGAGSVMSTGTGGDDLSVKDIYEPSQFVILVIVDAIAERDAEIKRRLFV